MQKELSLKRLVLLFLHTLCFIMFVSSILLLGQKKWFVFLVFPLLAFTTNWTLFLQDCFTEVINLLCLSSSLAEVFWSAPILTKSWHIVLSKVGIIFHHVLSYPIFKSAKWWKMLYYIRTCCRNGSLCRHWHWQVGRKF